MRERLALSRPREASSGKTGSWRTFRPVVDREACNACGLCAQYCPDGVIDEDLN
ncbi:MAG: 4Fe-4S binding protein, partial [Methanoculleus sp.]